MTKLIVFLTLYISSFNIYAINPLRKYQALPDQIGLKYEAKKIKINRSIQLNSWLFLQEDKNKPFIIVSNSDSGNMSYCLGQASEFFKAGYNVVLYDYRGFGESSDFEINHEMMYYNEFAEDLRYVLKFVKKNYAPKKIILYGLSMGTIISKSVLNEDKSVTGAIFDSFVVDPNLIVSRILKAKNKLVLLPAGTKKYVKSNSISSLIPILIFSGLKDTITRSTDYSSFMTVNVKAKLITWNCNHLECFYQMTKDNDSDLYMLEVKKFIDSLK